MDDKKIIKDKTEDKKLISEVQKDNVQKLHTNPIIQKMLRCNILADKMKFKFKDLFR